MDIKTVAGDRRIGKALLGTAIGLAAYAIVGFLVIPRVVKSVLTRQLSAALHRTVSIREVQVNPFVLAVKVSGLDLKDRDGQGPFVSFEALYLNFQLASVYRGGPVLRDIILKSPRVTVIRNEDLRYNFSDIIDGLSAKPSRESAPLRYSLNNIRIVDGSVDFEDRPKRTRHAVRNLRVDVPFLSNLPYFVNTYVQPVLLATINGTPIDFRGRTKPFSGSRETSFDIDIDGFDIPHYLEYVPARLRFRIASALLDTRAALSFREYRNRPPVVALTGKVALRAVRITDEKDRPVLGFPLLEISVASSDVFSRKASLERVLLQSPELFLVRDGEGRLNVASLFAAGTEGNARQDGKDGNREREKERAASFTLEAAEVRLAGGRVAFTDLAVEKPFRTVLFPVDIAVRDFSNVPGKKTAVVASLTTEARETFRHDGVLTVEPLGAEGTVEVKRLPIRKYFPYVAKTVLFDVEDGILDLSTRYRYGPGGAASGAALDGLSAALGSLRLRKRGEDEDFLKIPVVTVREAGIDLGRRTVTVGELSTRDGKILVRRRGDGTVNVATLVPPAKAPDVVAKENAAIPEGPATPPPDWVVTLGKVAVDRYAVKCEDKTPAQPVSLSVGPVALAAENISTKRHARGKVSLRLAMGEGSLAAAGTIALNPLAAALTADLQRIAIVPFQPYFTDKVKIIVTRGFFSAAGSLTMETAPDNTIRAAGRGDVFLTNVASVDKTNSEDFVKWESLHLGGIKAGSDPPSVAIGEIALADFYSRIAVDPGGALNVQQVFESARGAGGRAAAGAAPDNAAMKTTRAPGSVRIGVVTLQGGSVSFSDRHVKPSYHASLAEIGGRISGLSSEESSLADVDLRGKLENVAPLEITGKINPLRDDLYVDLKVDFKDIDLSPMTPYSGRYAGYAIEKGKLTLALTYLIARKRLDAGNSVFLDQLTFGDAVESPDATKLPVRMAVALLKDRKGEIRLDLPLNGSLDDPKFNVWKVVIQVLRNILVKAATSPFALLSAIIGGGEELSYVEFPYGRAEPDNTALDKLRALEKALYERPALKLEIVGHVDAVRDRDGLRQEMFERKLRAQKVKDLVKSGTAAPSLDTVRIEPAEYARYLGMAYKSEKFPKPRNIIGMAKDLPVPEMETLILTHLQVTDDDLRLLAQRRSRAVRERLLAAGRVEPERLFLVEPGTLSPDRKETLRDSRVDFVIR